MSLLLWVGCVGAQTTVPQIAPGGVLNAADYTPSFSPGILVAVFGSNLARGTSVAQSFPLPTVIDGVSVDVIEGARTLRAPLFFVSAGQVNFLLPFEVSGPTVQVRLRNAVGISALQTIAVKPRNPRLLTQTANGRGEAVLTHANYQVVTAQNPALAGEVLILFLTGLGEVTPTVVSGAAAGDGSAARPLNRTTQAVTVRVDGKAAEVYFAGLAPGFAGLYQVNFQAPVSTGQGMPEIQVEMGENASQEGVAFACVPKTERLSEASIGAAGGTLSGGGARVSVAAGALAGTQTMVLSRALSGVSSEAPPSSEAFVLAGFGGTLQGPVQISLPLTRALAPGSEPVLVWQGEGGRHYIPARVEGGQVIASLGPLVAGNTTQAAMRAVGPTQIGSELESTLFVLYVLFLLPSSLTELLVEEARAQVQQGLVPVMESTHFSLKAQSTQAAEGSGLRMKEILDYLEGGAIPWLREHGLMDLGPWSTNKGGKVHLELVGGSRRPGCGGVVYFDSKGEEATLQLDLSLLTDRGRANYAGVSTKEMFLAKAAHLLAHYVTQKKKEDVTQRSRWVWMDESVATLLELRILVEAPGFVENGARIRELDANWIIDPHGLEYWASTEDPVWLRGHGNGAARFVKHLSDVRGIGILGRVYALKSPEILPVEAMTGAGSNVSSDWRSFVEKKSQVGQLVEEYNWTGPEHIAARRGELEGSKAGTVAFAWNAPDLSAEVFPVRLLAKPPTGAKLRGTVSGGGELSASYYRVSAGRETLLGQNLQLAEIDVAGWNANDEVWVVVVNRRMVKPYTGKSAVAVTLELRLPDPDLLSRVQLLNGVRARIIGIRGNCRTPEGFSEVCGDWLFSNNNWSGGLSPVQLPIVWTGNRFQVNGTFRNSAQSVEMIMSATYDPATNSFVNGEFKRVVTYTNNSFKETTEFKFRTLPWVSPSTRWEVGAKVAEDPAIRATIYDVTFETSAKVKLESFELTAQAAVWLEFAPVAGVP